MLSRLQVERYMGDKGSKANTPHVMVYGNGEA